MKIRKGFVSNSSSSSFIVVLDKPIEQYSYEEFLEDYELNDTKHAQILFRDLGLGKQIIEDLLTDEPYISIDFDYDVEDLLNYDEVQLLKETIGNFGKKELKNLINKKFDISDGTFCKYILSYSDDGEFYSKMEHQFMPSFRGTKKVISHH